MKKVTSKYLFRRLKAYDELFELPENLDFQ